MQDRICQCPIRDPEKSWRDLSLPSIPIKPCFILYNTNMNIIYVYIQDVLYSRRRSDILAKRGGAVAADWTTERTTPPNSPLGPKSPWCGDRRPLPPHPPCPPWPPGLPRRNIPLVQAGWELSAQAGASLGYISKVHTVHVVWFTVTVVAQWAKAPGIHCYVAGSIPVFIPRYCTKKIEKMLFRAQKNKGKERYGLL